MWDLPGPGIEPVSPALAGGFLTTAPSGKSCNHQILISSALIPAEMQITPERGTNNASLYFLHLCQCVNEWLNERTGLLKRQRLKK